MKKASLQDKKDNLDKLVDEQLLLATDKQENVRVGKWYNGKLNINKLLTKKVDKGYCHPPQNTKKGNVLDNSDNGDYEELTLENYKPNKCSNNLTPSKGGYKRQQLYKFGIKYLKIPYTQLKKINEGQETYLQKTELCKIINQKFREIKTHTQGNANITDKMRKEAYSKDISNCPYGNNKGGYKKNELKNIAISYFNLSEDDANNMSKEAICEHISKILSDINEKEEMLSSKGDTMGDGKGDGKGDRRGDGNGDGKRDVLDVNKAKFNLKYPGDISLCNETPNRGGFTIKKLKFIAKNKFGLTNTESKSKSEICTEIANNLKTEANKEQQYKGKRDGSNSNANINKFSYDFDDVSSDDIDSDSKDGDDGDDDDDYDSKDNDSKDNDSKDSNSKDSDDEDDDGYKIKTNDDELSDIIEDESVYDIDD